MQAKESPIRVYCMPPASRKALSFNAAALTLLDDVGVQVKIQRWQVKWSEFPWMVCAPWLNLRYLTANPLHRFNLITNTSIVIASLVKDVA